jgi:D-tyrosyl-tRNA(Tyr) deacylase
MRVLLQRVTEARVDVDGSIVGAIGRGLLVLLAVSRTDSTSDADYLANKVVNLRVFQASNGKMDLSVQEVGGSLLVVSQFTLYGDSRKGRRPSYDRSAGPDQARELYEYFVERVRLTGVPVQTGVFQAHMSVHLINDGPVTLMCDSDKL